MKLGLVTRYSDLGASSRLRFTQFIPFLQKEGFEVFRHAFFDDAYLQRLYSGQKRSFAALGKYYASRKKFLSQADKSTPLVIEYELFPHLPWIVEKYFLKKRPYILNFDDAVDIHYEKLPVLRNKYPQLIAHAAGIITANESLKEKFSRYNNNILLLPTIPPATIEPGEQKPEKLTIVWTGTPITAKFLLERAKALQLAAKKIDFQLQIVGGNSTIPGVDCQLIPWSEAVEAEALKRAHAGIMPLPDTPFARGKSAYKLICYLRAGIPGIASPVGANNQVIRHGENGFFFNSDEEFAEALLQLKSPETRRKLMENALTSGTQYELPRNAKIMADFIKKSCGGRQVNI